MIYSKHAKEMARDRIPEARTFSETQLESYLGRLLKFSEILSHDEMNIRFPDFNVRGETTYFVLKSLIFVVKAGVLVTVIEMNATNYRRLVSYAN